MKRISKRTREQAALICAVQASTPELQGWFYFTAKLLGLSRCAPRLAVEAWLATPDGGRGTYACAEALLRTGWSP